MYVVYSQITINKLHVERKKDGHRVKFLFESYKSMQIMMIKNNNGQIYYVIHVYNSIQRGDLSFDCRDLYQNTARISSSPFLIVFIFTYR